MYIRVSVNVHLYTQFIPAKQIFWHVNIRIYTYIYRLYAHEYTYALVVVCTLVYTYIHIYIQVYASSILKQIYLFICCSLSLFLAVSLSVSCSFFVFQRCATNINSARSCVCTLNAETLQLWNIRVYKSWTIYKNLNICDRWFHLIGPRKLDVICLGPNLKSAVTCI